MEPVSSMSTRGAESEKSALNASPSERWEETMSAAAQDLDSPLTSESPGANMQEAGLTGQDADGRTSPSRNQSEQSTRQQAHNPALERFRAGVRKVIQMNRSMSAMSVFRAGAEPGIDPRRSSTYIDYYDNIRERCTIQVIDYGSVRSKFRRVDNDGFIDLMVKEAKRAKWAKVRWINIGGISWDVLSELALKYGSSHLKPI